jgi:hypothetical protein
MFYGDGIMTGLKSASKGSGVAYRGAACGTGGWVEGERDRLESLRYRSDLTLYTRSM